jgi:hypothetical protein
VSLARSMYAADPGKWRLDFAGWNALPREHQVRLLIAIGDCDGEWWGDGRAEFTSMDDAIRAAGWAARLQVAPPPRLMSA